jgi:hypothetical protein
MQRTPPPAEATADAGLTVLIPKWLWDRSKRPDRSREGFDAAFTAAIAFVAQYRDWQSIDGLMDEIALIMQDRLRLEVICEFIAVHAVTGRPRIVVHAHRHTARHDVAVSVTARPASARAN